jgi:hypothetical protein
MGESLHALIFPPSQLIIRLSQEPPFSRANNIGRQPSADGAHRIRSLESDWEEGLDNLWRFILKKHHLTHGDLGIDRC